MDLVLARKTQNGRKNCLSAAILSSESVSRKNWSWPLIHAPSRQRTRAFQVRPSGLLIGYRKLMLDYSIPLCWRLDHFDKSRKKRTSRYIPQHCWITHTTFSPSKRFRRFRQMRQIRSLGRAKCERYGFSHRPSKRLHRSPSNRRCGDCCDGCSPSSCVGRSKVTSICPWVRHY